MYFLNKYFGVEPLLVLWFVRRNIQKVKPTSFIKDLTNLNLLDKQKVKKE